MQAEMLHGTLLENSSHNHTVGDEVTLNPECILEEDREVFIADVDGGNTIRLAIARCQSGQINDFKNKLRLNVDDGDDARTLAIKYIGSERGRDFSEAVDACAMIKCSLFKVFGPRTAPWCIQSLKKKKGGAIHHEDWKPMLKLTHEDFGVVQHGTILSAIALALEFDQLNVTNCASFELLLRKAQLTEHHHAERMRV